MRIGFDAKRAFHNQSGLGNYSRDVLRALTNDFPANQYLLYTPSASGAFSADLPPNASICLPSGNPGRLKKALWRRYHLSDRLNTDRVDVYHGLSNELPRNLKDSAVKSVVTIHDLIFLRYPQWYPWIDRQFYRKKFREACESADKIVAISQQTRDDIIDFYKIPGDRIEVVYQSCHEGFKKAAEEQQKKEARSKYELPEEYILYVGTIEARKNLLSVVRAIHQGGIDIPLVVVGRKTSYLREVLHYVRAHGLKNIVFLSEVRVDELPAIYQQASVFVYPSLFEGFGIPVLEALYSKVPVITSRGGCFSEVGGEYSKYVNPEDPEELAAALSDILQNPDRRAKMQEEGFNHAQKFNSTTMARQLMNIYTELHNA